MNYDLFISYSRKDFNEVSSILETIKTAIPNLSYWFDIAELRLLLCPCGVRFFNDAYHQRHRFY